MEAVREHTGSTNSRRETVQRAQVSMNVVTIVSYSPPAVAGNPRATQTSPAVPYGL